MPRKFKVAALILGFFFGPSARPQTPTLVCRPLASPDDAVAGDEKVVGNQACKIVARIAPPIKPAPTKRKSSAAAALAPPPTPSGPTPSLRCRSFADSNNFLYDGEQLVGPQACKIIVIPAPSTAAAANQTSGPTANAGANTATAAATPAQNKLEPGMYLRYGTEYKKVLGQTIDFQKGGSTLASFHIKSAKESAQLLGEHSQILTGQNPEFFFIPSKQESDAGVKPGDLILVHLEIKKECRLVEVADQKAATTGKGALAHQIELTRAEVNPGVYKIVPAVTLGPGEYGIYFSRGESTSPYIYDFTVN